MSQNRNSRCARNRRLPYGRTLRLAPYSLIRIGIRHILCIGKSSPVRQKGFYKWEPEEPYGSKGSHRYGLNTHK